MRITTWIFTVVMCCLLLASYGFCLTQIAQFGNGTIASVEQTVGKNWLHITNIAYKQNSNTMITPHDVNLTILWYGENGTSEFCGSERYRLATMRTITVQVPCQGSVLLLHDGNLLVEGER